MLTALFIRDGEDLAPKLRKRLNELVIGKSLRPSRAQLLGEQNGMNVDDARALLEREWLVVVVREREILSDAKRLGLTLLAQRRGRHLARLRLARSRRIVIFQGPHQASRDVPQQWVRDETLTECIRSPCALRAHGCIELADLLACEDLRVLCEALKA